MRTERDTGDVRTAQECYVVIEDVEDGPEQEGSGGPRVIRGRIRRIRRKHALVFVEEAPPPETVCRPARVARMLALAHRLQEAIDRGDYQDRAELARVLGVTKARVSQILDLTLLAPEIQEEILCPCRDNPRLPSVTPALYRATWSEQRALWSRLRGEQA